MTIRTRLQLFSMITLAVMLVTAILLYSAYRDFQGTNRHLLLSLELQRLVTERVLLRDEYLVNNSARAALQWRTKSNQVAGILHTMEQDFTDPEEREIVRSMKESYQATFTEFSKVLAARQNGHSEGLDRIRLTMVLVKAYELYENSHQLSLLHQREVGTSIFHFFALIAVTLFLLTLLIWVNAVMLNRLIRDKVMALHQGAVSISGGNLDFRIASSGSDELNDLSDSFNAMADQLKQDITERNQAEEELSKLNSELEQRVKDRTTELEKTNEELHKLNRIFVGRELRMVELKEQIRELEKRCKNGSY
jgi:methyl-accepting chemotaxis protein